MIQCSKSNMERMNWFHVSWVHHGDMDKVQCEKDEIICTKSFCTDVKRMKPRPECQAQDSEFNAQKRPGSEGESHAQKPSQGKRIQCNLNAVASLNEPSRG
jgi:hypothetical protein